MPRSILVALTGLAGDHSAMETAIAAARIDGGHITGLHARIDVIETAALAEITFPQRHDGAAALRKTSREETERSGKARAVFNAACGYHHIAIAEAAHDPASISASWKETESIFNETVENARYHELVVMAREPDLSLDRLKEVLMGTGRPLLIAPPKTTLVLGRNIALAWKAGPPAARAMTAAMPWLRQAEKICILVASQNPAGDERDRVSAGHLAGELAWAGVRADVRMDYSRSRSEGQRLEDLAYGCDADLLVMGGYGHTRLRELVLGGVTEHMLSGCAVPVLLVH